VDLKITILYDNTVFQSGLRADWGFACLLEGNDYVILFDTGADGEILLSNMKALNVDPLSIDTVFISHAHFDHTGGLSAFLNVNPEVTLYCPNSFRGVRRARKVIHISNLTKLDNGLYSTGELKNVEQSLAVETEQGTVLVIGCAHPGMEAILHSVSHLGKVRAVIGGFHGFREFDLLRDVDWICPTHCTQYSSEIHSRFPEKTIEGGVGQIISL
jgi:7,8-dihydropterin-6-yl-methyl-4-(beta-D-ribofuranosyl)aminobenzene 5'-phosphate synthase